MENALVYENEPFSVWLDDDFNRFCLWCAELKTISDIQFYSGCHVFIKNNGIWQKITKRKINYTNLVSIINQISRDETAEAMLVSGKFIDFNYVINAENREKEYIFRCNATACRDYMGGRAGASLIMRIIQEIPPSLEDLDVEPALMKTCHPPKGLVLITGTMGNGKSTLMAAILRHILQNEPRYISTFEDPIEFNLLKVPNPVGIVTQSEIHRHIESFKDAPVTSSRRAVDVLYIGESRDVNTLMGVLNSADMGMAVYTTVHSDSVPETIQRICNVFPFAERDNVASSIVNTIQLIVQQRLVPKVGGGRIAIREYLIFTDEHKKILRQNSYINYFQLIQKMVEEDGVSLERAARIKLDQGMISEQTYKLLKLGNYDVR